MSANDLKDVKVGDAVRVSGIAGIRKQIVTRVTATQVTLDNGERFTRRGRLLGEGYVRFRNRTDAQPWNESEHKKEMREQAEEREINNIFEQMRSVRRDALTLAQLRRIAAIIAEPKP